MSQQKSSYDILMISSKPPHFSAGLANSQIKAWRERGHNVDFLTIYDYDGKPDNVITLFPKPLPPKVSKVRKYILNPLRQIGRVFGVYQLFKHFQAKQRIKTSVNNSILFLYPDEKHPPIDPSIIISHITKKYDAVITLFWEGMLNSTSLKAIYEHVGCPIMIGSPDMAPMTGGCYYFGTCRNFEHGCGNCPALNSNDSEDQSHKNFLTKKHNYSSINCCFVGNTWMRRYAEKSGLFKQIYNSEVMIDPIIFSPGSEHQARINLGIQSDGLFVILINSNVQPRKGNKDIAEAIKKLSATLPPEKLSEIVLLLIGGNYFKTLIDDVDIRCIELGRVDTPTLVDCYRASNVYVCASNDDAGPSMINQSLMCGTPVVSYNTGTAIDVIENYVSGYKVELGDKEGLANGILEIYNLNREDFKKLRNTSRDIAYLHNSPDVSIANKIHAIREMQLFMLS